MGARQSKRSVDISGKEAESAGEVAAAGAGGEGRVEQIADVDALKPQINGDAHIHEQETDKEKELDSGTPENEKDATTEKETKENGEEKEAAPVTNGNSEQKPENGEPVATPEDGKKPKKEKVKKKWSLRSISFSRKDKPKQEKKQKDEEAKTNGETEKVLEETTEATAEQSQNETVEVKTPSEAKDDKTPETPDTEPITNGHSTPETPQVESPALEQPAEHANSSEDVKTETKTEIEPEQLPVNGLSIVESKNETPEVDVKAVEIVENKVEDSAVEKEVVPVSEIPVTKEVCVEKIPLIETSPPPLPANPPPSSVASFAATTMAPELTDASLSNTAEITFTTQEPAVTNVAVHNDTHAENTVTDSNNSEINQTTSPSLKDEITEKIDVAISENQPEQVTQTVIESTDIEDKALNAITDNPNDTTKVGESISIVEVDIDTKKSEDLIPENKIQSPKTKTDDVQEPVVEMVAESSITDETLAKIEEQNEKSGQKCLEDIPIENNSENDDKTKNIAEEIVKTNTENVVKLPTIEDKAIDIDQLIPKTDNAAVSGTEQVNVDFPEIPVELPVLDDIQTNDVDFNNDVDELPPPPPMSDDEVSVNEDSTKNSDIAMPQDHLTETLTESIDTLNENKNIDITTKTTEENIETDVNGEELTNNTEVLKENEMTNIENIDSTRTNGKGLTNEKENDATIENKSINDCADLVGMKAGSGACNGSADTSASDEVHHAHTPQEPLPTNDKMDLIPDIPVIPEIKTETETSTDVAVAN